MAIRAPDGAKKQTALKRICKLSNLISFITSGRLLQHILRNHFEPSIYYFDLLFFIDRIHLTLEICQFFIVVRMG